MTEQTVRERLPNIFSVIPDGKVRILKEPYRIKGKLQLAEIHFNHLDRQLVMWDIPTTDNLEEWEAFDKNSAKYVKEIVETDIWIWN